MNNNAYVSSKAVKGCIWTCKKNVMDLKLYFVCLKLFPREHKLKKTTEIVLSVTPSSLQNENTLCNLIVLNTFSHVKYKILYLQIVYSYVCTHYTHYNKR